MTILSGREIGTEVVARVAVCSTETAIGTFGEVELYRLYRGTRNGSDLVILNVFVDLDVKIGGEACVLVNDGRVVVVFGNAVD